MDKVCSCGAAMVRQSSTRSIYQCPRCQRRTVDGKVIDPGKIARPATPEIKR